MRAYVDDLLRSPLHRIELDNPAFSQEGDFHRVDPGLRPEHPLDRLKEVIMRVSSRRRGCVVGKLTSTQDPQVMPSIRNSHFSVFPMGLPRGSSFMRGSSTLPGVVAEVSLYQRPEKADERADMAVGGEYSCVVVVQEQITGGRVFVWNYRGKGV